MKKTLLLGVFLLFFSSLLAVPYISGTSLHKDTLSIQGYPESTFGIYIPAVSDPAEIQSIIYLFGDATNNLPLIQEYKSLAQDFSTALVYIHPCSKEIALNEKYERIRDQVRKWIPALEADIYTAGQGESVSDAFYVAIENKEIKGLIGINLMEHTVEELKNEIRRDLDFIEVTGYKSSSFYHTNNLRKYFKVYRLNYKAILYDGGSVWPSADGFWEVLDYLKFDHARQQPGENVKYLATRFQSDFGKAILMEKKQPVQSYLHYHTILKDYDDLFNKDAVASRIVYLERSKRHQQKFREAEKYENMEQSKRRRYEWSIKQYKVMTLDTSIQKPLKWWRSEIDELTRMARSKNEYKANMGSRLLDFLSRETEKASRDYISRMDYYTALKMNEIWIYMHPEESSGYYDRARLFAFQFQTEETLKFLERAYQLGLSSVDLSQEESFDFLNGNFRYHQILHGVNSRK